MSYICEVYRVQMIHVWLMRSVGSEGQIWMSDLSDMGGQIWRSNLPNLRILAKTLKSIDLAEIPGIPGISGNPRISWDFRRFQTLFWHHIWGVQKRESFDPNKEIGYLPLRPLIKNFSGNLTGHGPDGKKNTDVFLPSESYTFVRSLYQAWPFDYTGVFQVFQKNCVFFPKKLSFFGARQTKIQASRRFLLAGSARVPFPVGYPSESTFGMKSQEIEWFQLFSSIWGF